MAQLFTNNAAGLLNASIASTDLSLTLQSGQGAKFPAVGGSDFFLVTLFSVVGGVEVNHEIVKVTARVNDTFTIQRGQEGTNPGNWSVGTNVQLRVTAGVLSSFIGDIDNLETDYNLTKADYNLTKADYNLTKADYNLTKADYVSHKGNTSNPHSVTKTQVGLGNVSNDAQLKIASNLSDLANVTTARSNLGLGSAALNDEEDFEPANANIQTHISATNNPHSVTKTQVGLSNVTNDAQLKIASNLSDVANVETARNNLGFNTAFSLRNKLINGNFDIWQRGTSQTISGYGSVDRWVSLNVGSTKTHSRQTFTLGQTDVPNNPKYFSRTVVTSVAGTSNYSSLVQRIEDVTASSSKTMVLTFWAKADVAKDIAIEFIQNFGTGGSASSQVNGDDIKIETISLTSSWQKFTIPVNFPSVAGKTLGSGNNDFYAINFWFDAGDSFNARTNSLGQQSGTFDIAQVQLEEGSIATPFEMRPIGVELLLCQRYYEFCENSLFTPTTATVGTFTPFKVIKRDNPSITLSQGTLETSNTRGIRSYYALLPAGNWYAFSVTANAEL